VLQKVFMDHTHEFFFFLDMFYSTTDIVLYCIMIHDMKEESKRAADYSRVIDYNSKSQRH